MYLLVSCPICLSLFSSGDCIHESASILVIFISPLCILESTYNWYHTVFVFLWFISLSTIPSSPSMLLQMAKVHSFYGRVVLSCQYILQILYHSPVDGHCAGFHMFAVLNKAAVNTGVHVSFWISVFLWFYS